MRSFERWACVLVGASILGLTGRANAAPVVYRLSTVADGSLGSVSFTEALVTIELTSRTETMVSSPSPSGSGTLYTNTGEATVSVNVSGKAMVARFAPGEIYVRYDTGTGVAGFGSPISPTYPVSLDCSNWAYPSDSAYTQDCTQGDWWGNPGYFNGTLSFFYGTTSLPQSLSQSALLTGIAHTCATAYSVGEPVGVGIEWGDLLICPAALRGLQTTRGALYLQDNIGGSNPTDGSQGYYPGSWNNANSGSLLVEVLEEREANED
jgi:hypothetical protein